MSKESGSNEKDAYTNAKEQHAALDSRLQMLLKKAYLTGDEELEVKVLKKKKLYFKDLMEKAAKEPKEGEK
jgi:hypothetical protein